MKKIFLIILIFLFTTPIYSAGSVKPDKKQTASDGVTPATQYDVGEKWIPDTLNLLGFSHRKIGDYENAEIYYSMGLEINPTHIGINEYMGELFVVTNRIDKAKERLDVLKDCNCKEYSELKQVIDGTKQSKY